MGILRSPSQRFTLSHREQVQDTKPWQLVFQWVGLADAALGARMTGLSLACRSFLSECIPIEFCSLILVDFIVKVSQTGEIKDKHLIEMEQFIR